MSRIQDLPAVGSLAGPEEFAVVVDPGGTPATRKATISQIAALSPSSTVGVATVDFGAFPGSLHTTVDVTGQTGIVAGSVVRAWIRPVATASHSVDEHIMAASLVDLVASDIVDGVGFTIHALARDMGSTKLQPPGIGRNHRSNLAAVANNNNREPALIGSVGRKTLSRLVGAFTIAWEWR